MREHDHEPVRGLPGALPPTERILWQGSPCPHAFARTVFFRRIVAVYFALLVGGQALIGFIDGAAIAGLWAAAGTALLGSVACALLTLFAWLYARTTVYTITNRRVVLRFGLAVPLTVNLPYTVIAAAACRVDADGTGDIALTLLPQHRVGYVHLWPLVQRWHVAEPRPQLRAVRDAAAVARVLGAALAGQSAMVSPVLQPPAVTPTAAAQAA